jgi:hypothetical protein
MAGHLPAIPCDYQMGFTERLPIPRRTPLRHMATGNRVIAVFGRFSSTLPMTRLSGYLEEMDVYANKNPN